MKINEIFHSIQGEGKNVGLPTIFVRTTGCNLRCRYCDTTYAYYKGEEMGLQDIMKEIRKWDCKRICLTGGEPLLQEEMTEFADMLISGGYTINIETNGSIDISDMTERDITVSMDIKCPSSEMDDRMRMENIGLMRERDELKFVIGGRNDYEYATDIIKKYKPVCSIAMQPAWGEMDARKLAEWMLGDSIDARLSFQLHKILWGNRKGI